MRVSKRAQTALRTLRAEALASMKKTLAGFPGKTWEFKEGPVVAFSGGVLEAGQALRVVRVTWHPEKTFVVDEFFDETETVPEHIAIDAIVPGRVRGVRHFTHEALLPGEFIKVLASMPRSGAEAKDILKAWKELDGRHVGMCLDYRMEVEVDAKNRRVMFRYIDADGKPVQAPSWCDKDGPDVWHQGRYADTSILEAARLKRNAKETERPLGDILASHIDNRFALPF